MKILFFTYTFKDYGLDALYDGLCSALGSENIFEYPRKGSFHGEITKKFATYPCSFNHPENASDEKKLEMLRYGEFDAILIGCRTEKDLNGGFEHSFEHLSGLVSSENKKNIPIFLVDQSDLSEINEKALLGFNAKAYFKREYLKEKKYDSRIVPLCFSYSEKYVPKNIEGERKNEIFWAGKEYHRRTYRTPYLLPLEKMRGARFTASFTQDEYSKQLLSHRIGLNLRGYGYDTVRYWELPAHATLLFSEKLNIAIENDFTDGKTAIFFESPEEMMDKLKFCLQNESYVDTIRMRGHEWFKKYHTSKTRAEQMLIKMENMGLVAERRV